MIFKQVFKLFKEEVEENKPFFKNVKVEDMNLQKILLEEVKGSGTGSASKKGVVEVSFFGGRPFD